MSGRQSSRTLERTRPSMSASKRHTSVRSAARAAAVALAVSLAAALDAALAPLSAQEGDFSALIVSTLPQPVRPAVAQAPLQSPWLTASPSMLTLSVDVAQEQRVRQRPSVVGGVVGFVVGAAAGGVVGCAMNRDSYGVFCGGQNDTKVVVSAAVGGLAGATAGALIFARRR